MHTLGHMNNNDERKNAEREVLKIAKKSLINCHESPWQFKRHGTCPSKKFNFFFWKKIEDKMINCESKRIHTHTHTHINTHKHTQIYIQDTPFGAVVPVVYVINQLHVVRRIFRKMRDTYRIGGGKKKGSLFSI